MSTQTPSVDFFFDPICPWCWMTSRWATEVSQVRGFTISWHPVSLAIINEANTPDDHHERHLQGKRLGQLAIHVGLRHGPEAVGRLYTELGTRIHPEARTDYDTVIAQSLQAVGVPPAEHAQMADSEDDTLLRNNTLHALHIAGPDVGVPIISVNGVAFFGPVMTPAVTGDEALRLWDGIYAAASVPNFYELKRGRTSGPQF